VTLNVALRARWRRALTSLTAITLLSLYNYSFCLCNKLLSLLYLEHPTRSNILTLLILLLLLALIFSKHFSQAGVSQRSLDSLAGGAVALRDTVSAAEAALLYVVFLSLLLSALLSVVEMVFWLL
ncbi:hypothetical protein COCVIDRAFT_90831, partial [Bipolaris victoriae FI3]